MKNLKETPIFKSGVWIKEQHGKLTIGSLDENDEKVMVIPDNLRSNILEFESDMIEALYGEDTIAFNPDEIDIEKLLEDIRKKFPRNDLRISFSDPKDNFFKGDYDEIFNLLEKLILSSLSVSSKKDGVPKVYINASVVQDHLCIIYRDSMAVSDPLKLKEEIDFIKTGLKGEISHKKTEGGKSYYDIMIPSMEK